MPLLPFLHRVTDRHHLTTAEAREAMQCILDGDATPVQIAAFLTALRMKGETSDEIAGFASAMRSRAERVEVEPNGAPLLDTCGTGGDGSATFNISTVAAFVAAGAGVRVAKHGNRSISSKCGSADLLEAMGIRVGQPARVIAAAIREVGIGFLFAPALHLSTRHAQPVRLELKMRTVFNLLGPLTNPAGATAQVCGAPSENAAELMACALAKLGLERGLVVYGSDGLDEITTTGPTTAFEISGAVVHRTEIQPSDFGLPPARASDLAGGERHENCGIAMRILEGGRGPQRDIVLANAAAALVVTGIASDYRQGAERAAQSIDSGAAAAKVDALRRFTQAAESAGA
jgi:anthranilate phosphoribosyltransferase